MLTGWDIQIQLGHTMPIWHAGYKLVILQHHARKNCKAN